MPFISYGGSSMLTNMMIIGLILNVSSQRQTSMFNG
ncbi:MAG: FtsW/RodA/SpoVE family cell cycle protein [Clostridia bacterium]